MRKRYIFFGLIFLVFNLSISANNKNSVIRKKADASEIVRAAAERLGGVEKLKSIKAIRLEGINLFNHIMDSEHPAGPFATIPNNFIELQNLEARTLRRETGQNLPNSKSKLVFITNDKINSNGFYTEGRETRTILTPAEPEWYLRNPTSAVLEALEAGDLRLEKEEITQSVPHYVVSYTWHNIPVKLFINKYNNLPTAVETVSAYPYDIMRNGWGDFTIRVVFSNWNLEPGGYALPQQFNFEWNGYPYQTTVVQKMQVNPSMSADSFDIPAEALKTYKPVKADDIPLGLPNLPAKEIAPNVIQIPGGWYTTIVKQNDGLIIIEAPMSSGYSAKVLEEAKRRFPNMPVKGVITSTNFWWHFAGLREYAAQGIPIYGLDANKGLIESFLNSPHRIEPDSLSKSGRKANLKLIGGKTVIGDGDNQLEVYPIRQGAAQMLIVYLRKHKILYTAEMAQPFGPGGSFIYPFDLASVMQTVKELDLNVETLIGMHLSATPYKNLVEIVEKVQNQKPGTN